MQVAYWIVAGVLALFYLYAGGAKIVRSKEALASMMPWAGTTIPMAGVRAIGVVEIAGAAGLILPPLTGVAPGLARIAAIGLVVLQVLAAAFHSFRHETKDLWLNVLLMVVAAVCVWLVGVW